MAVSVESLVDCIGNPLKARVMMLMREFGPMTPKQILQEDPRIPPASLYRALKSMEQAGVIEMVSETKVRAVVEKTYYFNRSLTERLEEDIGSRDGESYCRLFMGFVFNLLRRFEYYATSGFADYKRDAAGFVAVPVYATPEELNDYMDKIMEVLGPAQVRRSEEQELRTIALVSAPPSRDFKEVR